MNRAMRYSAILMVCAALSLGACQQSLEPATEGYRELPAEQVMIGVTHMPTSNGVRSAIGKYDSVYVREDSSRLDLKGVNLELFEAAGSRTATLTALTGELDTNTDAMVARGSVRLVTVADNRIIETEELHYDPTTRRVWSDVATTMREGGETTQVEGFTADDQFKQIQFRGARGNLPGMKVRFE